MSLRLVAVTLALSSLSACAIPRTAIVAGAATAIVGGVLIAGANHKASPDPINIPANVILATADVASEALGAALIALGTGTLVSGVIGLGIEDRTPAPTPIAREPEAPPVRLVEAPPGSATAVLHARSDELAIQLRVESQAGHCAAAAVIARRLGTLDPPRVTALIDRDDIVARCLAYRM